jgi:hypothetical protein
MAQTIINKNQLPSDILYNEEWQKPADWMDIRCGAMPNSVYFLVGHSEPVWDSGNEQYSVDTYPQFGIKATFPVNTQTYDVFVDGVKIATTAHNTETLLDWGALYTAGTIQSGYNVTYPAALVTHIVRITPTDSSHTFDTLLSSGIASQGTLWVHSTLAYSINLQLGATQRIQHPVLEVVTCAAEAFSVKNLSFSFARCPSLKYLPIFDAQGETNPIVHYSFWGCGNLKKIHLRNFVQSTPYVQNADAYDGCSNLEQLIFENCQMHVSRIYGLTKLKELPSGNSFYNTRQNDVNLNWLTSIKNTFLDCSDAASCTRGLFQGNSANRCDGIKGIVVSNAAPFSGSSPQLNVSYTGLDRNALVKLFKSMPYNIGYEVVGSPTITDGVASGFSGSNYLRTSKKFGVEAGQDFEFFTKCTIPSSSSQQYDYLFSIGYDGTGYGAGLAISNSYSVYFGCFALGTFGTEENAVVAGGTYYIKAGRSNGQTYVGFSTDKENWTTVYGTGANMNNAWKDTNTNPEHPTFIGRAQSYATSSPFNGSIDLNETYFKINGIRWSAFDGITRTCSVVGCTGTADLTQEDKNIALNKSWELTVA